MNLFNRSQCDVQPSAVWDDVRKEAKNAWDDAKDQAEGRFQTALNRAESAWRAGRGETLTASPRAAYATLAVIGAIVATGLALSYFRRREETLPPTH